MTKKLLAVLLAAVMLFSFAACGSAETETTVAGGDASTEDVSDASSDSDLEYITEKGNLVIGYTEFAPMNYTDESGEFVGFETEFAKAVCEKLGVEPVFQLIDWKSKETELNAKSIDCIWNGMTIDADRAANMAISTPYMANKQVLVVKSADAEKYTDAASLEGAQIVAEQGSAGETVAKKDEIFAGAVYTAVDLQSKALMEVAAGTADGAIVDFVTSIGMIGEGTSYEDLVVVESLEFADEQYGIAFRKGSDTRDKVNEIITELVEDGTLMEIAEKYKLGSQIIAE